jgi:hypothetical protein
MKGGLCLISDLSNRTFHFRKGKVGEVVQAGGPLTAMTGDAAGWVGLYAGVSIVLDVVPTQSPQVGRGGS